MSVKPHLHSASGSFCRENMVRQQSTDLHTSLMALVDAINHAYRRLHDVRYHTLWTFFQSSNTPQHKEDAKISNRTFSESSRRDGINAIISRTASLLNCAAQKSALEKSVLRGEGILMQTDAASR